jgi:hypothetical protein
MRLAERTVFLLFVVMAAVVTCAYYGPFLHNFFAYDDFGLLELVTRGPKAILLGYNYTLRFVNNSVWMPLYALSGYNPLGYNLFGMLLWFLNAILLYCFLRRLLDNPTLAAVAGFIFTASAVGADAVLWRAASGTLLNVTFYLLTLYTYTIFRQTGDVRKWRLSIACFVMAMFSKEEAASLPLVVILLEWLYFNGRSDIRGVLRRVLVYFSVILFTILMNYIVIYQVLGVQSELAGNIFKFRPLHSLLSGWTVFFLAPDGRLAMNDPRIYVTAVLIPLSFFLIKDRRMLVLGLGWIFLSFLPQSLSGMSQFELKDVISVSLSRHLYLPSIGAAIVYTALLTGLRERFTVRIAASIMIFFLTLYLPYNYSLISSRGEQWQEVGDQMKRFLTSLKKQVPQFPPNTHVFVDKTPAGRAFVQQALRAFYNNQSITYIVDPAHFYPKPGETALLITCRLADDGEVGIRVTPLE